MLLKVNDRSRSSIERLTQSIEKQAAAYGKTGVDRLIAERDRLIRKLGDEQGMVDRLRTRTTKMIAAEQKKGERGGGFEASARTSRPCSRPAERREGCCHWAARDDRAGGRRPGGRCRRARRVRRRRVGGGEKSGRIRHADPRRRNAHRPDREGSRPVQFRGESRRSGYLVFERMMRGLTNALTENAARARRRAPRCAVRRRSADSRPATIDADLAGAWARALNAPEPSRGNACAAMDLFKRAGIEPCPCSTGVEREPARSREQQGFGPTEDGHSPVHRVPARSHRAGHEMGRLMRKFKEGLVTTLRFRSTWIGAGVEVVSR